MPGTGRSEGARHDEFVERLRPAVLRAAAFARSLEGTVANAPKLHEASLVKQALTMADLGTQEIILKALLECFPDVSLAAEEDTETVDAFPKEADAQVVIDPIDDEIARAYGARPDRLYLIDRGGRIAYQGSAGPFGFKPPELEAAIQTVLASS